MVGKVPCLTRTRAGCGGYYWIAGVDGLLTTRDAPLAGLAGVPHHDRRDCRRLGAAVVPDDRQCNVSERLGGNFKPVAYSLGTLLNLFRALRGTRIIRAPSLGWAPLLRIAGDNGRVLVMFMLKSVAREDALSLPTLEHSSIGPG